MVISQIAGLATAFGTGELSGAGFGPNYTILMKLGYEFFAPRILEEMEKNPNVFFQDTLWFQKFQKQIKLYSDKVMKETLDTLLSIPQETIDSIQNKFQETLETGAGGFGLQGVNDLVKIFGLFMQASQATQLSIASAVQFAAAQPGHGGTGTLPPQPLLPTDIIPGSTPPIPEETEQGPPEPALTQKKILEITNTYLEYRQKGGLLSKLKWNEAKFGLFPTGNVEITRQINVVISQTKGRLISGATSPRRRSQSTNITLAKLNKATSLSIINLQRTAKITPRGNSPVHLAAFRAFRILIQQLKNWIFTYR